MLVLRGDAPTRFQRLQYWFWHDLGFFGPGWMTILVMAAIPFLLVLGLALLGLSVGWPFVLGSLRRFVETHNDSRLFLATGVAGIAGLGGLMYVIRDKAPIFYGIAEVSGALILAWVTLSKAHESNVVFAVGIMGAVYILVRGVGNIRDGERRSSLSERVFTSSHSHLEALQKGVEEILSKEKQSNAGVEDRAAHHETYAFVVLGSDIKTADHKVREYRVRVDHQTRVKR